MKNKRIKYNKKLEKIDKNELYSIEKALKILKSIKNDKFIENVDVVFQIKVDKNSKPVSGFFKFPKATKISKKIIAIAESNIDEIKKENVFKVGGIKIIKEIVENKQTNFDLIITTPNHMKEFVKFARYLGPRNLMPNIKNNTITNDVIKSIRDFNHGCAVFRCDKSNNLNISIGKISLSESDLLANYNAIFNYILKISKKTLENQLFVKIFLSLTMSPSIAIKIS